MIGSRRVRLAVVFPLTIALLSCGSSHVVTSEVAQTPLSVDVQFEPTPAHSGHERITVTVHDSNHNAVTGAVVSISPSLATVVGGRTVRMPSMRRVAKTVHLKEAGDGLYRADLQLTDATHWTFAVDVAAARTQTTITQNLKVR